MPASSASATAPKTDTTTTKQVPDPKSVNQAKMAFSVHLQIMAILNNPKAVDTLSIIDGAMGGMKNSFNPKEILQQKLAKHLGEWELDPLSESANLALTHIYRLQNNPKNYALHWFAAQVSEKKSFWAEKLEMLNQEDQQKDRSVWGKGLFFMHAGNSVYALASCDKSDWSWVIENYILAKQYCSLPPVVATKLAIAYYQKGDIPEAKKNFDASGNEVDTFHVLFYRAICCVAAKQNAQAKDFFYRAMHRRKEILIHKDIDTICSVYSTIKNSDDISEAESDYKQAVKEKNYQFAIDALKKIVPNRPLEANYYLKRADVYWKLGQFDRALEDCKRACWLGDVRIDTCLKASSAAKQLQGAIEAAFNSLNKIPPPAILATTNNPINKELKTEIPPKPEVLKQKKERPVPAVSTVPVESKENSPSHALKAQTPTPAEALNNPNKEQPVLPASNPSIPAEKKQKIKEKKQDPKKVEQYEAKKLRRKDRLVAQEQVRKNRLEAQIQVKEEEERKRGEHALKKQLRLQSKALEAVQYEEQSLPRISTSTTAMTPLPITSSALIVAALPSSHIIKTIEPPAILSQSLNKKPSAIELLQKLQKAGYDSSINGGVVRNILLNKPHKGDIDFKAPIETPLKTLLENLIIPTADPRLFRVDGTNMEIFLGEGVDFTINLGRIYAKDSAVIIDYSERCLQDLKDRIIDTIEDPVIAFQKDPLLFLRAIYFEALGYSYKARVSAAFPGALLALELLKNTMSSEDGVYCNARINSIWYKLLFQGIATDGFARLLQRGALAVLFPELTFSNEENKLTNEVVELLQLLDKSPLKEHSADSYKDHCQVLRSKLKLWAVKTTWAIDLVFLRLIVITIYEQYKSKNIKDATDAADKLRHNPLLKNAYKRCENFQDLIYTELMMRYIHSIAVTLFNLNPPRTIDDLMEQADPLIEKYLSAKVSRQSQNHYFQFIYKDLALLFAQPHELKAANNLGSLPAAAEPAEQKENESPQKDAVSNSRYRFHASNTDTPGLQRLPMAQYPQEVQPKNQVRS